MSFWIKLPFFLYQPGYHLNFYLVVSKMSLVLPWQPAPPADNNVCFCLVEECYMYICWKIKLLLLLQWCHNERNGISNHQRLDCLLNSLSRRRSKKTSKLRVIGLCEGNSPVTGEFTAQRASNAENVSIWWHHVQQSWGCTMIVTFQGCPNITMAWQLMGHHYFILTHLLNEFYSNISLWVIGQNIDKMKRQQTEMSTDPNVDRHEHWQTKTSTNQRLTTKTSAN